MHKNYGDNTCTKNKVKYHLIKIASVQAELTC